LLTGLELLMESRPEVKGSCNLGNSHEITIGEIAWWIVTQTGSSSSLRYRPLRQDDPRRRKSLIGKAERLLRWRPLLSLERRLRATVDYFSPRVFAPAAKGQAPSPRLGQRNSRLASEISGSGVVSSSTETRFSGDNLLCDRR
jgi:UDP-glucuronate decarboxylase